MIETEPSPPVPCAHLPRRLFQYRLRTLLIVTAIFAICLGWWSYKARQQQEAVAAVGKAGGYSTYRYPEIVCGANGEERMYKWRDRMIDYVGPDYFVNVVGVDLGGTQINEVTLTHVTNLAALKNLNLEHTKVTNADLEHLWNLTELELLDLRNTQVTDAGVARLQKSLPNCRIKH